MKVLSRILIAVTSLAVLPVAFFADAFIYYIEAPGVEDSLMEQLSVKQLIELLVNNPNGADELLQIFKPVMPYAIAFAILFVLTLLSAVVIFVINIVSYNPKVIRRIAWLGIGCFFVAILLFYGLSKVIEKGAVALGSVLGNSFIDTVSGVEYNVAMTLGVKFVSTLLFAIILINMGAYIEAKKKKS